MPLFELAHISDLHFSSGASAEGTHSHSIAHLEGIQSILATRALDRLIVSGDLTDRGDVESFLRVHEWLHRDFGVAADRRVGLNLPVEKVRVVPGNHDAYNARRSGGSMNECWQKSLANYNSVFPHQPYGSADSVAYDWIEKDGFGVFLAFVDTCYLNDPGIEAYPDIAGACVSAISKPARGRLTKKQSHRLLELFDAGMRGRLMLPAGNGEVRKETFAKSLKILVMHHYLFEPPRCADDFFLKLEDRDRILRNIAMADIDMCLCGHKHHADFSVRQYGKHFDKRSRGRYCLNLFRRMIGIHSLPVTIETDEGQRFSRAFTLVIQLLYVRFKRHNPDAADDHERTTEALVDLLQRSLEDPRGLELEIRHFIRQHDLQGEELISDHEIVHIQRRIAAELSVDQRKAVKALAQQLRAELNRLLKRPFVQIMAGSASKRPEGSDKARSFNIYTIEADEQGYQLSTERYVFGKTDHSYRSAPDRLEAFTVEGFQRLMFPDEL